MVRAAIDSTANEMFLVTVRTAKSPIIYETYDFSTGITNAKAETVGISLLIPLWAGVHRFIAKSMVLDFMSAGEPMLPGDIVICNDPYTTGTHMNDIGLAMPIFDADKIIAIATAKGHCSDIGGMNPGSFGPGSTEIFQEGTFIPPVKYYHEGKLNEEVLKILVGNSRIPDYMRGDLEALAASLRLAEKRMKGLIAKYGSETVRVTMEETIRDGERMARARLAELPMGEFYAEDFLDEGFTSKEPLKVSVKVKITKDEFLADFTGNPEAPRVSVNTTLPATFAAVGTIFLAITNPRAQFNQGLMAPIRLVCPENTIFNAKRPRPVSVYWETMTYAEDLVWKALAPSIPDKMSAGHFLSICSEIIAGTDPRNGEYFVLVEPNPGGWGAANNADGESALMNIADGETYANPVEVLEIRYPVIVEKHKLNTEAGSGPGRFRGGVGMIKDYKVLADDAVFTTAVNRSKIPPWGVAGGQTGVVNSMVLLRDGKELMRVSRILGFKLDRGDVLSIRSGGGGGWGDPFERDTELVLGDVHNRMITEETAEKMYAVAVDTNQWVVDQAATARLRANQSGHSVKS